MAESPADQKKQRAEPRQLVLVTVLLILFGLGATAVRVFMHESGQFPAGDSTWTASLITEIYTSKAGAQVRISPPFETRFARLYGQTLSHPDSRQRRTRSETRSRDIVLVPTRTGRLSVEAKFNIHISRMARGKLKQSSIKEEQLAAWLTRAPGIPVDDAAITTILDTLTRAPPETETLIERVFQYVGEQVRIVASAGNDGGAALALKRGSSLGMTRALITLLRAAHLPSRIVTGLDLSTSLSNPLRFWTEVYHQGKWLPVDVVGGHLYELPATFVPLRKGSSKAVEADNAQITYLRWQIRPADPPRGLLVSDQPSPLHVLDLTRLSPDIREVLALLLLLPLGALSTELLRQLGGIRTYGTFTPTLLALAAVYVDWFSAAIVFSLVTVAGVAGRSMLPDLKLSRVPRLAIVFTLITIIMALVLSTLIYLNPTVDSAVVLLPIVILTTLVDRIYAVADERGKKIAVLRLGWTLAAAVMSTAILLQTQWGEWLLAFPELHAITIAFIILLGSYRGKQLANLPRLRWLGESKPPIQTPSQAQQGAAEDTGNGQQWLYATAGKGAFGQTITRVAGADPNVYNVPCNTSWPESSRSSVTAPTGVSYTVRYSRVK